MEMSNGDDAVPMEVSGPPTESRHQHEQAADRDADTPRPRFHAKGVLGEHKKAVSSIKFSRDGKKLATASADTEVYIWDLASGQRQLALSGHTHGISDVAWARDQRFLASGSDDKTIRLWDIETGTELNKLTGHTGYVFCLTFNPQGSLIASGSCDEHVKLWDLRSGVCLRTLPAHAEAVTAVDFNRDGTCIVSASHDGLIRVWDTSMGECLKTLFAEGNPPVSHVRFSPNGRFLLASSLDSSIRLWSISNPSKCFKTYRGHRNERFCATSTFLLSSPQGQHRVVSGSEDSKVYIWDLQTRAVVQTLEGHKDVVLSVATHPTEPIIASGGMKEDRTIRLWQEGGGDAAGEERQDGMVLSN